MGERVKDKVALVLGAGAVGPGWGNGKATAVLLAREGARVFGVDRNPEALAETKGIIDAEGGVFVDRAADVTRPDELDALVAACLDRFGRIDVLVNNAGIFYDLDQTDHSLAYLKKVLEVNMIGPWLCARAVVPAMKRQRKGKIINQSSGAAWMYMMAGYAMPKDSEELPSFHYSVSKAGVNAYTHYMAAALGKFGINVNAIAPGVTMTEATRKHVPESMMGMITMMAPLGRTLEPDEIASAAVFLSSDESDAITGQVIPVDAGVTMLG